MDYVIFLPDGDPPANMRYRPVPEDRAAYLVQHAIPGLAPLADEDYVYGPAGILSTMARFSYVQEGDHVFWCVEWTPGLLVIQFGPGDRLAWNALRSPVPGFGGRPATQQELEAWDEDAPNPQYDLVFDAWDASMEEELPEGWRSLSSDRFRRFESAMAHANDLGERFIDSLIGDEAAHSEWMRRCEASPIWRGVG